MPHTTELNIFTIIKQGNLTDLQNILSLSPKTINSQEALTQNTPIMYTALFAKKDLFDDLMGRADCDLNILNKFGCSVLSFAILGGEPSIVKAIIDDQRFDKAGITLPDQTPQTPLELAKEKCDSAAQQGNQDKFDNYNTIVELLSRKPRMTL
jgi:hypothetical protein